MKKILIVGPSWVGDLIMSQTLLRHLKQQHPDSECYLLAPEWCLGIASRMTEVTQTITLPFKHGELGLRKRHRFAKSLRAYQFDQAIVLPNSWKSALIPFWAQIPIRTGWWGECRFGLLNDGRQLDKTLFPLMAQRFAALAYDQKAAWTGNEILIPHLVIEAKSVKQTVKTFKLKTDQPILVLCPGAAYGPSKCWPIESYAEVAKAKAEAGWAVWLLGSPKERALLDEIAEMAGTTCHILDQATLAQKADLMSLATMVVSNDSGLMHMAAALRRPLSAIYGSTTPDFTPPLSKKALIYEMTDLPCRPCFRRECPLLGEDHLKCLVDIKPEKILEGMAHLPEEDEA